MAMISNDWLPALQEEFHKDYYKKLYTFVRQEYSTHVDLFPCGWYIDVRFYASDSSKRCKSADSGAGSIS